MSSKEGVKSILSYNARKKDDPICSDKELERKLMQLHKDIGRLLQYVDSLENKSRRDKRKEKAKQENS